MGDQFADQEEKMKKLIDILRNDLCPACRQLVASKLKEITGQVEVVIVHD